MRTRHQSCECLALYGTPAVSIDERAWLDMMREYLETVACAHNTIILNGETWDGSIKDLASQYVTAEAAAESVEVYSAVTPQEGVILSSWDVYGAISRSSSTAIICISSTLQEWSVEFAQSLTSRMLDGFGAEYGIGYRREMDKGPELYALGMVSGLGYSSDEMQEADRISAWFHELAGPRRFLQGHIRDVYPINLLTNQHLAATVGSVSLMEHIQESHPESVLLALAKGKWLWCLADDEIPRARCRLRNAGLILC